MSSANDMTDLAIWNRVIQPDKGDMSEQGAREWLKLALPEMDQARVQALSAKANAGTLTSAEDQELERYLRIGRTLECMKAKARLSLNKRAT